MVFTYWLSQVASGASFIDALHQDCVQTLRLLADCTDQDFQAGYALLVKKVEVAFRTEEKWMEEINFYELKHHREQHAGILHTLHQGQIDIMRGKFDGARQMVKNRLPEWLLFHASTMDAALATELQLTAFAT